MLYFDGSRAHFRGNLHLHTTGSDGVVSQQEAARLYADAGYDFIAVTDHWHRYQGPDHCGRMAILPGIELDVMVDPYQTAHIVGFGVSASLDGQIDRSQTPQQLIDAIVASGGYAVLAHPAWSLNTNEFITSLHGLTASEVFNSLSRPPWNGDRSDASNLLDAAAARGVLLPFLATDDTHFYNGEQLGGFTVVQCGEPAAPEIGAAIAERRCYASQGPAFNRIEIAGNELIVECSPSVEIMVCSNLFYRADRCLTGKGLTRCVYPIRRGSENFVRCRITDEKGLHAWTSPLPV